MASDKNLRYQVSNTSSIIGLKNGLNTFTETFANIDFNNRLSNPIFNRLDISNILYDWTIYQVTGTYDTVNGYFNSTFGNQGYLEQDIHLDTMKRLKPNTIYSAVLYASSSDTGTILEVSGVNNYQVYDINDTTNTNSASAAIEVNGTPVKHMISFRTNATTVSGGIYVKIRNTTTVNKTIYLKSIFVYEGLIEINGLPEIQLPIQNQSDVESGSPYSTIIFNEAGIAVSAAQRAQSSDKLYNVGGAVEATINDSATGTDYIWTSSKVNSSLTSTIEAITTVPIGTVISIASNAIPTGWLPCEGASLSTATYSSLFAAIGYTFGGVGATFSLPDLRGEFIRGWDNARGIDVGRTFGTLQLAQSASLTQVETDDIGSTYGVKNIPQNGTWSDWQFTSDGGEGGGGDMSIRFLVSGADTRPRNIALRYIIKY